MEHNRGKSVTTSVPSISIKFHANAEQVEELYASDEETTCRSDKSPFIVSSNVGEPESSPLKYLPKLIKRSTSVDVSAAPLDSSPPSDPWKFLSEIRGKITKSVEDKITEIKQRNHEDSSPSKSKTTKDSKENSSLSDSEDLSESSISKTCGILSTTEGVEMSSEEDSPSSPTSPPPSPTPPPVKQTLRQRFRFLRRRHPTTGTIHASSLDSLRGAATGEIPPPEEEAETAVEAVEVYDNMRVDEDGVVEVTEVMAEVGERESTVFAPLGFVDVRRPEGTAETGSRSTVRTIISIIIGTVSYIIICMTSSFLAGVVTGGFLAYILFYISSILQPSSKETLQDLNTITEPTRVYEIPAVDECKPIVKFEGWMNEYPDAYDATMYHICDTQPVFLRLQGNILKVSNAKSKVPKRHMWNERKINAQFVYHRVYNLFGAKICLLPDGLNKKRHWSKKYPICIILNNDQMKFNEEVEENSKDEDENEKSEPKQSCSCSNSKKKDKNKKNTMLTQRFSKLNEEDEFEETEENVTSTSTDVLDSQTHENSDETKESAKETEFDDTLDEWTTFTPDKESPSSETRIYLFGRTDREKEDWYRKLTAATHRGANVDYNKIKNLTTQTDNKDGNDSAQEIISDTLREEVTCEEAYYKYMSIFNQVLFPELYRPRPRHHKDKKIHLEPDAQNINSNLPRSRREVKTLFKSTSRSSKNAEKRNSGLSMMSTGISTKSITSSSKYPSNTSIWDDNKNDSKSEAPSIANEDMASQTSPSSVTLKHDVLWFNTIIGRVMFDCMRDPLFTARVKERFQRKLSVIKLPYFIEKLTLTDLDVGNKPPLIWNVCRPVMDDRGLWIDLDVSYEGLIACTIVTKVNLMKLMQENRRTDGKEKLHEQSAMFNSDVDDSAESSSDEDTRSLIHGVLDSSGYPTTAGGHSSTGKKFVKIVDKIADSKLFQAATEYSYVRKAMAGVSNTDLRLTVNINSLSGTLVLNIPPPPNDRIWLSFRPLPKINLKASPIVGEKNINFLKITSWIEHKLLKEFEKIFVVPNMEDIIIPGMCPDLPR